MAGSLLGDLSVSFSVDMSGVTSGVAAFQSSMSGLSADVEQVQATFAGLEGAADGSRMISNVDVAQAQLTLIESKVQEARKNLQELQNSADAGQAVTGIPEAEAQLTLLEAKAQEARASLQDLQNAEQDTGDEAGGGLLSGIQSAVGGVMGFTSQLGMAFFAVQQLYQGAVNLAQGLLQPAETAETTQLSFTTLLHSTTAAKNEMQALNTYAAGTPLQTQWADEAAAKILAFGGTTQSVIPEITAIGDSLSGLGKLSESSLNSIVDVFGKISAQGKITGGDMMQLSDWGIPAWQALSTAMGKPIPVLQQMVSAGLIPASTAIPALEKGMENVFGGGMQKQAATFAGLMSTFASNWNIAIAALGTPILKDLEPLLEKLGTTLGSPAFQNFASSVGQKIADVFTNMGPPVETMVSDFQKAQPILQQIGNFLVTTFAPVWDQLVTTWQTQLIPAWNQFMTALQPALPSLELIGKALGGLIIMGLIGFLEGLADALQVGIVLMGAMAQGASALVSGYLQIVSLIQPVWQAIAAGAQWLYDLLLGHSIIPDLVNGTIAWFTTLGTQVTQKVASLITGIANHFTGLPAQASKWMADFGNSIVSGINAMAGRAMAAAANVANAISSVLHFSTPDTGPLADVSNWMPDFGNLLSSGLNAQVAKVKAASLNVALAASLPSPSSAVASPLQGGSTGSETPQTIQVYLDSSVIAQTVMTTAMKRVRIKTGMKV